jgi:hypothetical protein
VSGIKDHIVLEQSIIKTLVYYDIFHYPLKSEEVFKFLRSNSVTAHDVSQCLDHLAEQNQLSRFGEYYTLQKNESDIRRRIKGNQEAKRYLPLARRQAELIAKFPFVRAVFASGSLSKGYMDENSDLDFFVITQANRLWICRALLALYKRIALKNSHKYFCTNYFIDTDHLEIEEKNLFTATELATLIPLSGQHHYSALMNKNIQWVTKFFPNFSPVAMENSAPVKYAGRKVIFERLLNVFLGNVGDKLLMKFAALRWNKLYYRSYSQKDFSVAFKTKRYASKNHPRNFQKSVMDAYGQLEEQYLNKLASK